MSNSHLRFCILGGRISLGARLVWRKMIGCILHVGVVCLVRYLIKACLLLHILISVSQLSEHGVYGCFLPSYIWGLVTLVFFIA